MNTTTFIKIAADIQQYAPTNDHVGYVENVLEPYADDAAAYYNVSAFAFVETAYKIASDIEQFGFVVLPE